LSHTDEHDEVGIRALKQNASAVVARAAGLGRAARRDIAALSAVL